MRAFAVGSFRESPALHDLPIPAADGALLIRVTHAGVNPVDYKLVDQLSATSRYPFILGLDFVGVVERVPAGERDLRAGDRVFGIARTHGSYAEYTAVASCLKLEPFARIPETVTDEQARTSTPGLDRARFPRAYACHRGPARRGDGRNRCGRRLRGPDGARS